MRNLRPFFAACALLVALVVSANDTEGLIVRRPVASAFMAEGGTATLADTYLTPLFYDGWHTSLSYERNQAMRFDPERWSMQLMARATVDDAHNPARNADIFNLEAEMRFAVQRRWQLPINGLRVGLGPALDARGGVLYLSRNGNNPASAKGAVTFDALGFISYRLNVGKLPVTFRYQGDLPVVGVFFSPDYGQLYYEIWLGERSGLVRPAVWGQYFRIDNLLTADLHLGGTTLRLGYHNDIISTKTQGITSRRVTHAFVLGVVTEWLSINTRKNNSNEARIISSIY